MVLKSPCQCIAERLKNIQACDERNAFPRKFGRFDSYCYPNESSSLCAFKTFLMRRLRESYLPDDTYICAAARTSLKSHYKPKKEIDTEHVQRFEHMILPLDRHYTDEIFLYFNLDFKYRKRIICRSSASTA